MSIALELENNIHRGLADAKRELETLPPATRREMVKVSRIMDEEGRKSGGTLAKGINAGLIRNSPLIAAGVAAALAAGAPVALAAAGVMFGGIAGLAASQSLEVRNAWMETWQDIRAGAVADSQVLVPAFTKMASDIGDAFDRMRPQIQGAFSDSAPLVDSFTDGIIALGENAMPGLVRAVAAAGPVFDGLESFLAATGTGLTEFFDAMSSHAPEAGTAFAALGGIIGSLLPILGELLGQGSVIASNVLPAVASATGLVADVMGALGPMLPAVVAGFVAFRAAQSAAGFLQTFALQAQFATMAMTGSFNAGSRVGSMLLGLGRALPVLAVAFGVASAQMAQQEAQVREWAQAILDGGKAAQEASDRAQAAASGFNEFVDSMQFGDQTSPFEFMFGADDEDRFREAQAAAKALKASMTEVERAEQDVTHATNYLNQMLDEHGAGSAEAEGAARALASAERHLAAESGATELAIQGVTSAMVAQAEQALAMANSDYAYRSSLEGIDDQLQAIADAHLRQADAQKAVNEARASGAKPEDIAAAERDLAAATEAASDAQFGLEGSLLAASEAAGRLAADALPATATELQRQQAAAAGSLAELERLKTEMGDNFPPALQAAIDRLKQSGVALTNTSISASDTAARMRDLGLSVHEVPGQKFVKIDAPTAPQIEQLKALGWQVVNLPNGDVYVAATTADAEAAITFAARDRTSTIHVNYAVGARPALNGPAAPQRASGGPVWPGQTFLVGEEGPELVRFAGAGTVIPAGETRRLMSQTRPVGTSPAPSGNGLGASGGSTTISVVAHTADERRIAAAISHRQQDAAFLASVRR